MIQKYVQLAINKTHVEANVSFKDDKFRSFKKFRKYISSKYQINTSNMLNFCNYFCFSKNS